MRRNSLLAMALVVLGCLGAEATTANADPPVVQFDYSWFGEEANQTDLSKLEWKEIGTGTSDFLSLDTCDTGLAFSCDAYPGAAPMVKASPSGSYTTGDLSGWNYKAPGGPDVYIKHVSALGANLTGPDEMSLETQGPEAVIGLWDGSDFSAGDDTTETGTVELDQDGEPGQNQVFFGLGANGDPFSEDHWGGLLSLSVILGDDEDPVATIDAPSGWIDETPTTIPIEASDDGMGLALSLYGAAKRNPAHILDFYIKAKAICTSLYGPEPTFDESLCPRETPTGYDMPLIPLDIREGNSNLSFTIADLQENLYEESVPIKIDTTDPTFSLGGSFTTAPGMVLDGPLYELDTDAADGNATVHNSGVKKIQVLVDSVEIDSDTQSCPGDDCGMELDTDIEPDNWSNGEHTLTVKVTDQVGHVKTQNVEFEVDR